MDLPEIKEFFDYQPIFDAHPQFLVDQIKELASLYLKIEDIPGIQKAYEFAHASHDQVLRLSGEPYIVHPLRATIFLMDMKPDLATIQTCILHDVIEDTPIEYEDIQKHFGTEVADLCEGLAKVAKIRYQWEDRQIETLKKTFLAMGKDLRVIFVKLADRIHNIQTLHYHPKEEKRERIARETLKVYVPIAKKLGLYHFQTYLENGAFKILYPEEFRKIIDYLKKNYGKELYVEKGIKNLTKILYKADIKEFEVQGRLKSPYRIYEKMIKKYDGFDVSKVLDVLAFRIVTTSVGDCYNALWVIHAQYIPLINKIKDYIAIPKFNGYKSIHTTVVGMFKFPIEIQIRTQEMDSIAEYGVAAHFAYSDNNGPTAISHNQSQWIQKLQELVDTYQNSEDKESFKDELNIEVLSKNIFVYTPKGDIIEMPLGSTVLDFAFRIHSDVGLKFKNALVNGNIRPISYKLRTGDIIQIMTYKNKITASKYRVDFLMTPSGKTRLLRYFHQLEKESHLSEAKRRINEKLDYYNLPKLYSEKDQISKHLEEAELERLLLKVLDNQEPMSRIIRKYYPKIITETLKSTKKQTKKTIAATDEIIIDEDKKLGVLICPECKPKIWEGIIAKSNKEWIKIHLLTCKALNSIIADKLLEAHRWGEQPHIYEIKLTLETTNKPWSLAKILTITQSLQIQLKNMHIENLANGFSHITMSCLFPNPSKISFLLDAFKGDQTGIKLLKRQFIA